jgi:hypothetical protein
MIGLTIAAGCGRADILCYTKNRYARNGPILGRLASGGLAALDHDAQKIADFSDRIMGENKEIGTKSVSF